jgi:hypothetical protein
MAFSPEQIDSNPISQLLYNSSKMIKGGNAHLKEVAGALYGCHCQTDCAGHFNKACDNQTAGVSFLLLGKE